MISSIISYANNGSSNPAGAYGPEFIAAASPYISQACSGVTKGDIANDTTGNLGKLCACYLPPEQYYLPGVIPTECDAMCSFVATNGGLGIYEYPLVGTLPVMRTCSQTTCVIDNYTAQYINSNPGDTTFTQVCGECGVNSAAGCTCIINGVTTDAVNTIIEGGTNYLQQCGTFTSPIGPIAGAVTSFYDTYSAYIWGSILIFLTLVALWIFYRA
jgi:hypothetical protein